MEIITSWAPVQEWLSGQRFRGPVQGRRFPVLVQARFPVQAGPLETEPVLEAPSSSHLSLLPGRIPFRR
jgi:hypothetical protein